MLRLDIGSLYLSLVVFIKILGSSAEQRPVYVIGHMVNSIPQVEEFLDLGSNVLEADVQFYKNGSIKEFYHGYFPACDCLRICDLRADFAEYLKHVRDITDPSTVNSYYGKMLMMFFDLKLDGSDDKKASGRDLARNILDHLWTNGTRRQEVRALVYFDKTEWSDVVLGVLEIFSERGQMNRLVDIGFDGGSETISDIRATFQRLGINHSIWQGHGIINCISAIYPTERLRHEIKVRDNGGYIDKVYHWTIDSELVMMNSLDLGVDGFITNQPQRLLSVLQEDKYKEAFRIATINDNPFQRFVST